VWFPTNNQKNGNPVQYASKPYLLNDLTNQSINPLYWIPPDFAPFWILTFMLSKGNQRIDAHIPAIKLETM